MLIASAAPNTTGKECTGSAEQQRRDVAQVTPPHAPMMGTLALNERVLDTSLLQGLVCGACAGHRRIFNSAANPQQLELLVRGSGVRGERRDRIRADGGRRRIPKETRTHQAYVAECLQVAQAKA